MYYRGFHTAFISRFKAITFVNAVNPEIYAFFYLRKHIALSVLFANETITIESNKSPTNSYMFPCLTSCRRCTSSVVLQEKRIMVIQRYSNEMEPERTYSISEAARYLGVHRCTLYAYINHLEHPLPFVKVPETGKLMFYGRDLIAYKTTGLPKRGRKRKNGIS